MSIDTLTTTNWTADQQRWLGLQPLAWTCVVFLRSLNGRSYNATGLALVQRILHAMIAATVEIQPTSSAPAAQQVVYGLLRNACRMTWYAAIDASATGSDGPILTQQAGTALATIETYDPLLSTGGGRAAQLAILLAGVTWRSDAEGVSV